MYADYYQTANIPIARPCATPTRWSSSTRYRHVYFLPNDKQTARVAAEFYINAINVMKGAEAISAYTSLPRQEAFNIEYWFAGTTKLQRMPGNPARSGGHIPWLPAAPVESARLSHEIRRTGAPVSSSPISTPTAPGRGKAEFQRAFEMMMFSQPTCLT